MISEVRPENASPEIAAIYADIRAVSGVPVVNLIWRHFASLPGVLEWAWKAVQPLVGSQEIAAARHRLETAVRLPAFALRDGAEWQRAGVSGSELADVQTVVTGYVWGNLTNLIALTALRLRLERPNAPSALLSSAPRPPSLPPLPQLPHIEALPPALRATIRALAASHDGTDDGTIPSLYLALAPWPGLVTALPEWLAALYKPEVMRQARLSTVSAAETEASALLPMIGPEPAGLRLMRPTLDRFTRLVIPDMVPVCLVLKQLIPSI